MKSLKINDLPNLYTQTRYSGKYPQGYEQYYFRYVVSKGLAKTRKKIALGDNRGFLTKTQLKERYMDAQHQAYQERNGLAPIESIQPKGQQPIMLAEIFNDWVSHESGRSKSWIRDLHNFKHFVIYFGNESDWKNNKVMPTCKVDLAKLTTKDINAFYKAEYKKVFRGKPIANETVLKRHNYINPLYTWLTENKLLEDNYYARKMKLKNGADTRVHYQVLTREQAELIVDNAPEWYSKIMWTIMLDTALSPVDVQKLNKKSHLVQGVGNNGEVVDCIVTTRQKSGKYSAIPISDRIKALGDDIWNLGGTKTDIDGTNDWFRITCNRLNIEQNEGEKLSQYSLRHSLATHLVNQGYSLDFVQRTLGHTLGSKVTQGYLANQIASEVTKTKQTLNK